MNLQNDKELTGYPSIDKPWLKYYSEEAKYAADNPQKCSIYQYIYSANKNNPSDIAIEYFGAKITYSEMFQSIDCVAGALYAYGVRSDDFVTICLPNVPEVIYIVYACNKIGAVANMIDPRTNSERILKHTNMVNSVLFITIADICDQRINCIADKICTKNILVVSAADSSTSPIVRLKYVFTKLDGSPKYMAFKEFVKKYQDQAIAEISYIKDTAAVMVYTSGTTGTAKGVLLSNEGIVASSEQLILTLTSKKARRFLAIIPFFSSYGFVNGMNATLGNKMTITLIPKYNPANYTKLILKHKPNVVISVPKLWEDMAYTLKNGKVDLSYMVYPISGGDKIPIASVKLINDCLRVHNSNAKLLIGYGATEFGAAISLTTPELEFEEGSCGAIFPIANLKIIAPETGKEVPYETEGEICIHSQSMMLGYYNDIDMKEITFKDGNGIKFYRTGDKGYISKCGALHIIDRYKRAMMRPDGHTVHATPIENTLMNNKNVRSCAVVGLKLRNRSGVIPTAFIVLNDYCGKPKEIIAQLDSDSKRRLPERDRAIAYIIVKSIPYTPNGKIDYEKLENFYIDEVDVIITDSTFTKQKTFRR